MTHHTSIHFTQSGSLVVVPDGNHVVAKHVEFERVAVLGAGVEVVLRGARCEW